MEAAVSGGGEERSVNCPTCTCALKCVVVGEHDITYQGSVTAVWLASLRQEVQQEVFKQFAHKPMATDQELQDFSTILDNLALAFKSKGSVNSVTARSRKQAGGQGDKKRAASEGGKGPRAASGEKGAKSGETCDYCRKTLNKEAFHSTKYCWRDPEGPWWRPNLSKKVSTVTPDSEKGGRQCELPVHGLEEGSHQLLGGHTKANTQAVGHYLMGGELYKLPTIS